jgi:hypothetical protein
MRYNYNDRVCQKRSTITATGCAKDVRVVQLYQQGVSKTQYNYTNKCAKKDKLILTGYAKK